MNAFFELHRDLPREGPGDAESLAWAVAQASLRNGARILDAGCGPGADLLALAGVVPGARVLGIEAHAPFVAEARSRVAGHAGIEVQLGDMAEPGGPFDLIWSAGALYFLGVEAGLRGWRGALAPGGAVAFSQICWFGAVRPEAAVALWADYEDMTDEAGVCAAVAAAGYGVVGTHRLSDTGWENYYRPLDARIAQLRVAGPDAQLQAVLEEAETEAAVWRAHRDAFGYLLVVARPR